MRAQRAAAMEAAGQRALQEVARGGKLSILGGGQGTGSSYLQRLGLSNATDILTRNALDQSNLQRSDFDAVERARMNLLGRRLDLQKAQLLPYQVRTSDFGRRIGNLGSLGGLSDMAYFTGLKEKENWANKAADSSAAFWNTASTAGSIAGSLMGGGGGGQQQPQAEAPALYGMTTGYNGNPYMSVPNGQGGGYSMPMQMYTQPSQSVYNWSNYGA